jgi:hypothetical protein
MFHWFTDILVSTTTTLTFFTIFLVGVVFSAFSLIMGAHSDTADHDISHDFGHDGDAHDGGDHGDHDGHEGGDAAFYSPFSVGMFSVRGVALLATGFGGLGFLIYSATEKLLFSTASALIGGYLFAFVVLYTLKIFKSQQANSLVNTASAIGAQGIVTVSIPEDGMGEVSLLVSGVEMFKPAVSAGSGPIKSGTRVRVNQITGGTLVVSPAETAPTVTNKN